MTANFIPSFTLEKQLIKRGCSIIAGVDEAGRGALAGPLSLGLVIFDASLICRPLSRELKTINDSKQLTPPKRKQAYELIMENSFFSTWTMVSHKFIDSMNVNRATEYALNKILKSIDIKPDIILMDGNFSFHCDIPVQPVKFGDCRSVSIASASIIAKVRRDAVIERFDDIYPGYHFRKNKGYGTKMHIEAIEKHGLSPIHRKSYDPMKTMLGNV